MKAKRIRKYGGPEVLVLEEVSRPEPGPSEVLIRVRAAAINPIDWKVREGAFKDFYPLPLIPGWDVAGEIEQIGAQVEGFKVGDAVFALLDTSTNGGYAEYARASESSVALKPETLDFISAASVPMASLTAYEALEKMGLKKGDRILIHGASGAVGSFAVQLAFLRGASVTALSSRKNASYVSSLGAEKVFSYEEGPFQDMLEPVDAVLDVIGGDILQRSWKLVRNGGILVSTVEEPKPPKEAQNRNIRGEMVLVQPNADRLAEIARMIDAGQLKVRISAVLPLSEAERAQEIAKTTHHLGKIVLQVG